MRVVVVGAGVVGLTTALALARDGHAVRVLAAEPPAATTSAVAAAFWYPYLVGPPRDVARWGRATADRLAALAGDPDVPVTARTVHEVFRAPDVDPAWRSDLPDPLRLPVPDHLTDGARDHWTYTSWVADMPRYLPWLLGQATTHGVAVELRRLRSLDDAWTADTDLVVDCAGVGARELAGDAKVEPVAGQVVLVRCEGVDEVWLDADGPRGATYVVPRTDTVVLGGTAGRGVSDRRPDDAVTEDVLARTTALVPALRGAEVLAVAVGLRPARPTVRLEVEATGRGPVLHHYGHGGAGLTLSWGAADEAAALAGSLG